MVPCSPYAGALPAEWPKITAALIEAHPLDRATLLACTRAAWQDIFKSQVGSLRIGRDIFPDPQIIGFFLHQLIPEEIAKTAKGWTRGRPPLQKDVHFDADPRYSIEIKTSSHPRNIFGNRSYAQPPSVTARSKDGYYLTVNVGKFHGALNETPAITRIRFGWLDHTDWVPQKSPTGQAAHLTTEANAAKLLDLL